MQPHHHDHYQIAIRLQAIGGRVFELAHLDLERQSAAFEALLVDIQSIAPLAENAALPAFAKLVRLVHRRLEMLQWRHAIVPRTVTLIDEWAAASEAYVRRPRYRPSARALVSQLDSPGWGALMNQAGQVRLVEELINL